MSWRRAKPRRRLRSDMLPILGVLAMPFLLAWIFPYAALSPVANAPASYATTRRTTCSFVELSKEDETKAIGAARTAWHVNAEDVRRLRIEMFADDLPKNETEPVIDVSQRTRIARTSVIPYKPVDLPSDLRAAPPIVFEKLAPPVKPVAFPREEMLKLD